MAKSSKIAATSKTKADATTKTAPKQTNSTNKLTGNNKRIQAKPISPGKKKPVAKATTKAATTKTPKPTSAKLTPPLKHYPVFLLAHQLPNYNETIAKAKQSPFKYQSEKKKTEQLLVSLFLYQYKTWYKATYGTTENPSPIPKPLKTRFTLVVKYQYSSNFDFDNSAFARKYILDALQTANIIPNDNQSHISNGFDQVSYKKDCGNFVTISLVPEEEILSLMNQYL